MTTTYDITTNVGKVRLRSGDNVITDYIFTNEEIDNFLDANSGDVNMAAADVLDAWAAIYMANADSEHIGDYSYTQKIVDNMQKLAKSLRERAMSEPAGAFAEVGYTDFSNREIIRNRSLRSG